MKFRRDACVHTQSHLVSWVQTVYIHGKITGLFGTNVVSCAQNCFPRPPQAFTALWTPGQWRHWRRAYVMDGAATNRAALIDFEVTIMRSYNAKEIYERNVVMCDINIESGGNFQRKSDYEKTLIENWVDLYLY